MLITGAVPAALARTIVALTSDDQVVRVALASARSGVACPACGTITSRIHSRYPRTLADLPWQGLPVQLCLTPRRFCCRQAACPQQRFAERIVWSSSTKRGWPADSAQRSPLSWPKTPRRIWLLRSSGWARNRFRFQADPCAALPFRTRRRLRQRSGAS